jgi:hypothetical protein
MNLNKIKKNKYLKKNNEYIREVSGIKENTLFECAVIIPAYDELEYFIKTLESLFRNDAKVLGDTLIIVVVNNSDLISTDSEVFKNNQQLLAELRQLNKKYSNLGWIDCSSKGCGLKKNGGVGVARKIGMDSALLYLNWKPDSVIFSLDADTIVSHNYLLEVLSFFKKNKNIVCATIPFEHLRDGTAGENRAISEYEFYLEYYVDMLKRSGSPYAYHAVGSAMTFRAESYIKAGGMKVNCAGEDFYFLQAMRKIGKIGEVVNTKVYQSSRPSDRVPFGTGPTIIKNSENSSITLYNPKIFDLLDCFLKSVHNWIVEEDPDNIQYLKELIQHETLSFLNKYDFDNVWPKIVKNNIKINSEISENECRNKLFWCFNIWFDAFKTLKFVHYVERNYPEKYPRIQIEEFKNEIS